MRPRNRGTRYNLNWTGAGSRDLPPNCRHLMSNHQLRLKWPTFPEWHGSNTALDGRREYRIRRQPLLIEVKRRPVRVCRLSIPRNARLKIALDVPAEAPKPFRPEAISLDGEWELAWCEKGSGPPTNGWRKVKVPGSAHTQWLEPSKSTVAMPSG